MATQTVPTVAEAQATLKAAQDAERERKIADAQEQLKQVRLQAKQLRARLAVVTAEIRQRDTRAAALLVEREKIDHAIRIRTSPNDDLLFDPDDFSEEVENLKVYREEVIEKAQAESQRGASRDEATTINNELIRLQFVARNAKSVIENRGKFVNYQGGVASLG